MRLCGPRLCLRSNALVLLFCTVREVYLLEAQSMHGPPQAPEALKRRPPLYSLPDSPLLFAHFYAHLVWLLLCSPARPRRTTP